MPKGDRLKLKADPEDGTTPISNLLLEAVAMAKLSGLEARIVISLCRQTYGWLIDGKRLKERKITLTEWQHALDSSKSRISAALKGLEAKNIVHRRIADPWGGYYYTLNTNIKSWNSDSLNLARLAETVTVAHFGTVDKGRTVIKSGTVAQTEHSSPVEDGTVARNSTEQLPKPELPTLYKENIKKDKERGAGQNNPLSHQETGRVFALLDQERNYKTTKRDAEAASITRMLKRGYSAKEIIGGWKTLKGDKFYQGKELFMMTVEGQIGALLKKAKAPQQDPDKYVKGKLGHLVQR